MNVLLIGDPHFKVSNGPESEAFSDHVVKVAREIKPNLIVNLGDTLDTHGKADIYPYVRAVNFIKRLASISRTVVLIGNHDRPNNSDFQSSNHFFAGMESVPNLTIVDKATIVSCDEYKFLCVPYVPPGSFDAAIETVLPDLDLKSVAAVFAHQEFYQAKLGAIRSECGDKWSLDRPIVYSGHVHEFQILQPNIIYVGSPIAHAFGDKGEHGLYQITWKDNVREDKRLPFVICQKFTYRIKANDVKDFVIPEYESKDLLPPRIRIVIIGSQAELKAGTLHTKVSEWKKQGVKVQFKADKISHHITPIRSEGGSFIDKLFEALNSKQQIILEDILS